MQLHMSRRSYLHGVVLIHSIRAQITLSPHEYDRLRYQHILPSRRIGFPSVSLDSLIRGIQYSTPYMPNVLVFEDQVRRFVGFLRRLL